MPDKRKERDFLGEVDIPSAAYYGSFTARALYNFRISDLVIGDDFVRALAEIKMAAAEANSKLGLLDHDLTEAIKKAADEVINGKFEAEFPLDVFQAGAGTPWNMNMNEVLANRANELLDHPLGSYTPIHPNDHVNMSQSSNDVIPTAIRITTLRLSCKLVASLEHLESALEKKANEFEDIMKSGRTHYRDAVPVTLGREFHTYASAVQDATGRLKEAETRLRRLPIGGTAVGTGVDTHPHYRKLVIAELSKVTGLNLTGLDDPAQGLQFASDFLDYMNALDTLAVTLVKIGNDLMLLSSGPMTGLGEIILPPVEPGSSIMPGKVNPSIIECVNMVCLQAIGCRSTIEGAAKLGNLDLNVYTPLIAFNLFKIQEWMTNAVTTLKDRCVLGIKANHKATDYYFEYSNAFATLLSPAIGYEKATQLAMEAAEKGVSVGKLALEKGLLSEEELEKLKRGSTSPNIKSK
jgi:aspartate ammonia-lyase